MQVKLARGDIFTSRDGQTLVRINFINKKHKSIQDCLGDPTCHLFERGKDNLWHLKTGKKNLPIPFRERDYRYVRPSSVQVFYFLSCPSLLFLILSFLPSYLPCLLTFSPAQAMAGKLSSQKGLIVEVDVKGYLAATNDVTDHGLYVENNANMKQVPYITCVYIPVLFL